MSAKEAVRLSEREWILSRVAKGPCTTVAIFGKRRPDYLTMPGVEEELKRMARSGELRFGNGKWYRP